MKPSQRLSLSLALLGALLSFGLLASAGQLLFDGVPVDITTATNEDLVIAPGEGGITQIGDKTGATRDIATTNDDLLITNNLEVEGKGRIEGALTVIGAATLNGAVTLGDASGDDITVTGRIASSAIPKTDSTYDLGSTSLAFSNLYVDTIKSIDGTDLALSPDSGEGIDLTVTRSAATGNETLFDFSGTVNKATSGNYTGLLLNVTETAAPGSSDRLLDLQVGGTRQLQVFNGIASTANYGLLSVGAGAFDGSTSGFFAGSSSGTLIAGNTASGFAGNLLDLQVAGTSVYKVDSSGNITQSGTTTQSGNLDMGTNLILNIGNASTDFTTGGGLTLAGALVANGNTTLGDASGDTVTVNAAAWTFANDTAITLSGGTDGINFDSNTLSIDATNDRVGIGTASPDRLLHAESSTALTNTVSYAERLSHITSGVPANNIGVGLEFEVETAADNNELGAAIEAIATDTTAASEDFALSFLTMAAGAAATETMRLSSVGALQIDGDLTISGDDLLMATNTSGAVLVADGTNFNPVVMGGQATISSTGSVTISDMTCTDCIGSTEIEDIYVFNTGDTMTGNLTVNKADPAVVFDVTTATDTDFWLGVQDDAGGTDDDTFRIGDGTTPGSNSFFIIDTSGNVGIGDTTPNSLLDIHSATTGTDLLITNTNATDTDVTVGFALTEGTNTFTIGVDDSDSDQFKISTTALGTSDRFVINSSGNVGIGTASPDRLLHAESSTALTNTVSYAERLSHITSGVPANNIGVGIEFEVETAADNNELGAAIEAIATDTTATSEDFALSFLTMAAGAAATETMRLSSVGALQIDGDLTISGDDLLMATNTSGAVLVADGTNFNPVVMGGDATIGTTGTLAIAANVLDFADFEDTLDVDANLIVNFGNNTGTINSTLVGSPFSIDHSGALDGSDVIFTLNADSTSSSGSGNVAFKIDVDDADVDALIAGDGTNYTTIQDDGKIVYTANAQPNRTMILTAQGGLLLSTQTTAQSNVDGTNFAYSTLDFDQTTSENAFWGFVLPDSMTGTTATFTPYWTAASGSGDVVWEFAVGGYADNEAFHGGALGGSTTSTDTLQTANAMHIGPAATVTHGWTAGDFAVVRIARLPANAGDTLNADARLIAVKIEWAASAESD